MDVYDYILIGGGPTALTLAYYLQKSYRKIAIIDSNSSLGGCHRVFRDSNNQFSEHSPRVYSTSNVNFISVLQDMNLDFYELFTPYKYSMIDLKSPLNIKEIIFFIIYFMGLIINQNNYKCTSVYDFMIKYNFSDISIDYIDRVCRLTDGTDCKNYSMNEFLQLINQQFLYKLYQPKLPNDIGLFKEWKDKLNCDIFLNTKINKIEVEDNVKCIKSNDKVFYSKNYILCIPPIEISKLIQNIDSNLPILNSYNAYIGITFHFKNKLQLPKIHGFPVSNWGIAFIVLSDYMPFDHTVISTAITILDKEYKGKTVNECDKDLLIKNTYQQLPFILPNDYTAIISKNVKMEIDANGNNKWIDTDSAYVKSTNNKCMDIQTQYKNLYIVGSQNGNSWYQFTSIESAVSNALYFLNQMGIRKKIKRGWEVIDVIYILIMIIAVILLKRNIRKEIKKS